MQVKNNLALKGLKDRLFIRRLVFLYKVFFGFAPQYLTEILAPQNIASVNLRSRAPIYHLDARTERYRNSFFPYCISQEQSW